MYSWVLRLQAWLSMVTIRGHSYVQTSSVAGKEEVTHSRHVNWTLTCPLSTTAEYKGKVERERASWAQLERERLSRHDRSSFSPTTKFASTSTSTPTFAISWSASRCSFGRNDRLVCLIMAPSVAREALVTSKDGGAVVVHLTISEIGKFMNFFLKRL